MNERVSGLRATPRSTLDEYPLEGNDSSGFVLIDKNGEFLTTLKLDPENQSPPERTTWGKAPGAEIVAKETESKVALTDRKQGDPELPPHALRQLSQTGRRWRIERSNTLSEEKLISLDRLQGQLSAVLGVNGNVDQSEGPRHIKVFRNLAVASPKHAKGPRLVDSALKTVPVTETSTTARTAWRTSQKGSVDGDEELPPQNEVKASGGRTQRQPVHDTPNIPVRSIRVSLESREREITPPTRSRGAPNVSPSVTFGQPEPVEVEKAEDAELEAEDSALIEDTTRDHRQLQNEYRQNFCSICDRPVSVRHAGVIVLHGYHYHKRCLADLFFSKEELHFLLRSRCRRHALNAAPKKRRSAWHGIRSRLSRFFRRK